FLALREINMVYIKDDIESLDEKIDEEVRVCGWIIRKRSVGKILFWRVLDSTGEVQVIFKKDEVPDELFETAQRATLLSAVEVKGIVRRAQTKGGKEIVPKEVIVTPSDPILPIDPLNRTSTLAQRLNYRALDLRDPKVSAIFKIRSMIAQAFREYFTSQGFVEIHTPAISVYSAEGGADVFEVKYFDKNAYLRQSPQLYKQLAVAGLEKVFEIGPAFRAEKHWTIRHLCEFTSMDIEVAWINDIQPLLEFAENAIRYIFGKLNENGRRYFEILGVEPPKVPDKPFPKITWEEAMKFIKERGIAVEGKDLPPAGERVLYEYSKDHYDCEFIWIVDWPFEVRPFYAMKYPNSELTQSMDLLYRGLEILTGGKREHRYEILRAQMLQKNLRPEFFGYYLEAFKYGFPPHGGWAIGLDRITMQILNLGNIRECTLFPRDPERLEP
ncbi:MAG: aspartate--tRNA(Asn) ligase, partial [Candidatus Korarchaeota archaeon]